jgi:hypothetical protein
MMRSFGEILKALLPASSLAKTAASLSQLKDGTLRTLLPTTTLRTDCDTATEARRPGARISAANDARAGLPACPTMPARPDPVLLPQGRYRRLHQGSRRVQRGAIAVYGEKAQRCWAFPETAWPTTRRSRFEVQAEGQAGFRRGRESLQRIWRLAGEAALRKPIHGHRPINLPDRPEGVIRRVWRNVRVPGHADRVNEEFEASR